MTESAPQLVRKRLNQAWEAALPALQARSQALPAELQLEAERCAEEIRTCLLAQAEAALPQAATQEATQAALVRLIFGHSEPRLVVALKEFVQVINLYLVEARSQIRPSRQRMDS